MIIVVFVSHLFVVVAGPVSPSIAIVRMWFRKWCRDDDTPLDASRFFLFRLPLADWQHSLLPLPLMLDLFSGVALLLILGVVVPSGYESEFPGCGGFIKQVWCYGRIYATTFFLAFF